MRIREKRKLQQREQKDHKEHKDSAKAEYKKGKVRHQHTHNTTCAGRNLNI